LSPFNDPKALGYGHRHQAPVRGACAFPGQRTDPKTDGDIGLGDRYAGFPTNESIKKNPKPSFKEWWERHPLYVLVIGFGLASTVWGWILVQNQNLNQQRAANELGNVRKELQAKIDDRDFRLSSIERHIGDKSFWDLSTLMVTPLQMKTLDPKYIYQKEINCFLSVPASASWHFIKVNGITMQMLFGNPKPSDESDPLVEYNQKRNIYLWEGPGSFKINTVDSETPILYLFPHVSIEEFNNEDFSEMVTTATKKLQTQLTTMDQSFRGLMQNLHGLLQRLRDLSQRLRDLSQKLNPNNGLPPQEDTGNSQSDHDIAFEKLLASIEEAMGTNIPPLTSDSSSFWASRFILQGFQLVKKIPRSTFHLVNAEKKENVFYLSFQTVFSPSETTAEIYWDQELILIGTGKRTLLVTTSFPWSADARRFAEGAWIAAWLAGLKVPQEQ
jgi:hypothetical protein